VIGLVGSTGMSQTHLHYEFSGQRRTPQSRTVPLP
jgi:murein DD-endopeptidase MepM/ murein hydrolase activator NlpD